MEKSMPKFGFIAALAVTLAACAAPGENARQMAREDHACAELGLTPGSAVFNSCVGNLDASLYVDEHSGHL
jgi:hypothetical protein